MSLSMSGIASFALACIAVAGCASTTAIPLAPGDHVTAGIRVYDKKPLLMVYDTGATIAFIPNYNRAYALQFTAFLAKNDVKTEFEDNSLKKLDTNLDSTEFIKLLTTIAGGLLGQGAPADTKRASAVEVGGGALRAIYEFEFSEVGDVTGLRRLDNGFPRPYPKPAVIAAPEGGTPRGGGPRVGEKS